MQPPIGNIDFTEDSPSALLIILRIIHLKLDLLPKKLSSAELLQLALLSEQYQCAKIIRPFTRDWILDVAALDLSDGVGKNGWLFIYWTFGLEDNFTQLAKSLVCEVTVDGAGVVWYPHSKIPMAMQKFQEPMPDKIIEGILTARQTMLENLLEIPYSIVDGFESFDDDLHVGWGICGLPACNSMIYGSLLLRLQVAQLWPRKRPSEIYWSVWTVAVDIRSLFIHVYPDTVELKHDTWRERVQFVGRVDELMKKVEDPVLECHRLHMRGGQ